jgi:gliding motility-associated-like protein
LFLQGGFVPGAQYLWNDGSTGQGLFVSQGGEYSVTVSIGNCVDQDTVFIDEQSMPDIMLGDDQYLCAGQPFPLYATTYGASYLWQDGSTDSVFMPQITGNYYVTVTNQCGTDADSIFMNFQDCLCAVFVPNAFSPNGDPTNQVFRFKQACSEFASRFRIYNRIGQLVYETNDPYEGWDGNYEGEPAPEGVYLYEVKYRAFHSGKLVNETKRGTVSLIR